MNFDKFSKNYREIHSENIKISGASSEYFAKFKAQKIDEFIHKSINHKNPVKLLDFGCGDGLVSVLLSKLDQKYKISCIDESAESISEAKKSNVNNLSVDFKLLEKDKIPYEDIAFDVVFAINVFHHIQVDERSKWLREIIRVLKPGGYIIIIEHNPLNPFTRYFVKTCAFDTDAVLILPQDLTNKLTDLRIKKHTLEYSLFFPRWKAFKKLLFLEKLLINVPVGGQYMYIGEKPI